MKGIKQILLVLVLLSFCCMALPYVEIGDVRSDNGFHYPLAYVSGIIMLLIFFAMLSKLSRTGTFITMIVSLSNAFFTFFMIVVISMYNDGNVDYPVSVGLGLYLNLGVAFLFLISLVAHTIQLYKSK